MQVSCDVGSSRSRVHVWCAGIPFYWSECCQCACAIARMLQDGLVLDSAILGSPSLRVWAGSQYSSPTSCRIGHPQWPCRMGLLAAVLVLQRHCWCCIRIQCNWVWQWVTMPSNVLIVLFKLHMVWLMLGLYHSVCLHCKCHMVFQHLPVWGGQSCIDTSRTMVE